MKTFGGVMGVLMAVLVGGVALHLGPEPEPLLQAFGAMAILAGPGFALLASPVIRALEGTPWLVAPVFGMAAGLANLLVVLLILTPIVGLWIYALAILFFLPFLAAGAAFGLGCLGAQL
jgi:hypothetical protein